MVFVIEHFRGLVHLPHDTPFLIHSSDLNLLFLDLFQALLYLLEEVYLSTVDLDAMYASSKCLHGFVVFLTILVFDSQVVVSNTEGLIELFSRVLGDQICYRFYHLCGNVKLSHYSHFLLGVPDQRNFYESKSI